MGKAKKYYAVHKGRKIGIFDSWGECKEQVDKFTGAIFKSFKKKLDAEKFVKNGRNMKYIKDSKKITLNTLIKEINNKKVNNKSIENIFELFKKDEIITDKKAVNIYTDGSLIRLNDELYCGYGVLIPSKDIRKRVIIQKNKTNNRAELAAIIKAVKMSEKDEELNIYTDSRYCILVCTTTGERYRRNKYKTKKGDDVKNKDLIKKYQKVSKGYSIKLHHIKAHTHKIDEHSLGNRIADELAKSAAMTSFRMKK